MSPEMHSKEFIKEMEDRLLEEKSRLEQELNKISEPDEISGGTIARYKDIGDDEDENAEEQETWERDSVVKVNLEEELDNVNEALQKIKEGTYGIDEETEEVIPEDRLRAYPPAKTARTR